MIRFSHVSMRYPGGQEALKDISFVIEAGEMLYLTGHSGAGKSTLLRLICRMDKPGRGQVHVMGFNTGRLGDRQAPEFRRRIGVVYQDHKLLEDRTVFDNVALPLVIAGYGRRQLEHRVRAALDQVGLLGRENAYPLTLSGGEQQRVGIARAVVNRPDLLLADEPTGNLDPELADEIMALFKLMNQYQVTVVVATHDYRHFQRSPARVLALRDGRLIHDGPA